MGIAVIFPSASTAMLSLSGGQGFSFRSLAECFVAWLKTEAVFKEFALDLGVTGVALHQGRPAPPGRIPSTEGGPGREASCGMRASGRQGCGFAHSVSAAPETALTGIGTQ